MATRDRARFHAAFPRLRITRTDWFSFLVYPLSGGFKPWSLIPARAAAPLLKVERGVENVLGRALGFRLLLVVERF